MIYHHWFFNHGFKFQASVYYGCQDLKMMSISNIAIITAKNAC